jgi:hypothetical protein
MDYMLIEGDWLGSFEEGDRLAECGLPAPPGGRLGQRWDGSGWVDSPDAQARVSHRLEIMAGMITAQRSGMVCSRWQMLVVLGEDNWSKIIAFRDSPQCNWATKMIIDTAETIPRNSEFVDMLAYVLGFTETETDMAFTSAMAQKV